MSDTFPLFYGGVLQTSGFRLYCMHPAIGGNARTAAMLMGRARCVFPTAWYAAGAESGVAAAAGAGPCSPGVIAAAAPRTQVERVLRLLLRGPLSLLTPSHCRLCASPLVEVRHYPACDNCIRALRDAPLAAACDVCCEPLAPDAIDFRNFSTTRESLCANCVADRPQFVRATAYGSYDDLRAAIHLMKFEGVTGLANPLGQLLAAAILQHRSELPGAFAVIPVPLFRGKRAFNQSTLLAHSALRFLRRTDQAWQLSLRSNLLRRTRHTESQFLLSPAQRRSNLRGAFAVTGDVSGLHVLLVDDVYTTGATAAECTRVLLRAGAVSVRVATLARAAKHAVARWQPGSPPARDRPPQ